MSYNCKIRYIDDVSIGDILAALSGLGLDGLLSGINQDSKNKNAELSTRAAGKTAAEKSFPTPVRAIFNVKTRAGGEKPGGEKAKKFSPVLASKVFFDDGTWVLVKNSSEDPISLVRIDGVETASYDSKERAIVYAWVKRLCGKVDPVTKEAKGAALGRFLSEVINASEDQVLTKAKKARFKAEKEARKTETTDTNVATLSKIVRDAASAKSGVSADTLRLLKAALDILEGSQPEKTEAGESPAPEGA